MDSLKFNLKARGEFLKILFFLLIAVGIYYKAPEKPFVYKKAVAGKVRTIKITKAPEIAQGLAGFALLCGLYVILVAKTTQVEAGRINFSLSRGIFVRRRDALDLTGITDFQKERTLLDMMLGISRIRIFSRDKTHPVMLLRGVPNTDADLFYDHMSAYSNKSMVEYVQGHQDRSRYAKKRGVEKDGNWPRKAFEDGGDQDDGSET